MCETLWANNKSTAIVNNYVWFHRAESLTRIIICNNLRKLCASIKSGGIHNWTWLWIKRQNENIILYRHWIFVLIPVFLLVQGYQNLMMIWSLPSSSFSYLFKGLIQKKTFLSCLDYWKPWGTVSSSCRIKENKLLVCGNKKYETLLTDQLLKSFNYLKKKILNNIF